MKKATINGAEFQFEKEISILKALEKSGIEVPTLCSDDRLKPCGACRLCLVEIKGSNKLVPACVACVREGMEVFTDSELLRKHRRMLVEMLFTEGNHICSICVENGHCELQDLAVRMGINHIRLPYLNPVRTVDASHGRFSLDHNRCVLCTRCVRVCGEVEGAHTWDVMGRGYQSCVITDLNQPWGDSETCTSCGKCVQVCPTGALFTKGKSVGEMTKHSSFLAALAQMRENGK